jgi:prophage antirepressor-like protein/phage anti-repressor protein
MLDLDTLIRPALAFDGQGFTPVELDGELYLRADELGRALDLDPPEAAILDLYERHCGDFPGNLSVRVPLETPEGPRSLRCFSLVGSYVIAIHAPGGLAVRFRPWVLATLAEWLSTVARRSLALARQVDDLTDRVRTLAAQVAPMDELVQRIGHLEGRLRTALATPAAPPPADLEGEFRRLFQQLAGRLLDEWSAQAENALEHRLSTLVSERLADTLCATLQPLADTLARLEGAVPAPRPAAEAPADFRTDGGVAALAVPDSHTLRFLYGDRPVNVYLPWNSGPWFLLPELFELFDRPEGDPGMAEWAGSPHCSTLRCEATDRPIPIIDSFGLRLLLITGWIRGPEERAVAAWLLGEVLPSIDALRLRQAEADFEDLEPPCTVPPTPPTAVVADGPFKVYAGEIGGRDRRLVNARDLHRFLEAKRKFPAWFEARRKGNWWRLDEDYVEAHVHVQRSDPYLSLDAALDLLWRESTPKALEAREYLLEVARDGGRVFEGEAEVVKEGELMSVAFHGRTLFSFKHQGEVYVAMKPLVESMGLQWEAQLKRIKRNPILFEGMSMTDIPTVGGTQTVAALPLKLLNGWLFGIDTSRIKENIREDIINYQRECYDVLYRYWHGLESVPRLSIQPAPIHPADTPEHAPHVFEYPFNNRIYPLRVAVREGRPWFHVLDLAAALNRKWGDARTVFGQVPEEWRTLRPALSGETNEPWITVEGLAWFLGGTWRLSGVTSLRRWLFEHVLSVLPPMTVGTVPPVSAPPPPVLPAPPLPEEVHYTLEDPLHRLFVEFADHRLRAEGRKHHTVSLGYGRLLAWLWRNGAAGDWIEVHRRQRFIEDVGIPSRTLARILDRLADWRLVERRYEPRGFRKTWPQAIRLDRAALREALAGVGLAMPE